MTSERQLGNTGLSTPPLVLGANVFGWTTDEPTSSSILDAFIAGGGRMIDTADMYSAWVPGNQGGESETVIGNWLSKRGQRDDVLIATKVGLEMGGSKGLAPARIDSALEGSLRRLQTDYVDVYFAHQDDPDTPLDETLAAFDKLVRAGKVRAVGASNYGAPRLAEALEVSAANKLASFTILQPHYNLLERDQFEGPLQDLCVERNIATVPYYGLAAGFLTGKYRTPEDLEGKARSKSVKGYLNPFGLRVLDALDRVSEQLSVSPAQVALAWLAAQPAVAAPIASATSLAQLEELLAAMRLTLTESQLADLDIASRKP